MLNVIMLRAVLLSVIMVTVIMLSVVAPTAWVYCRSSFGFSFYFWRQKNKTGKMTGNIFDHLSLTIIRFNSFLSLRHWQRTKIS